MHMWRTTRLPRRFRSRPRGRRRRRRRRPAEPSACRIQRVTIRAIRSRRARSRRATPRQAWWPIRASPKKEWMLGRNERTTESAPRTACRSRPSSERTKSTPSFPTKSTKIFTSPRLSRMNTRSSQKRGTRTTPRCCDPSCASSRRATPRAPTRSSPCATASSPSRTSSLTPPRVSAPRARRSTCSRAAPKTRSGARQRRRREWRRRCGGDAPSRRRTKPRAVRV